MTSVLRGNRESFEVTSPGSGRHPGRRRSWLELREETDELLSVCTLPLRVCVPRRVGTTRGWAKAEGGGDTAGEGLWCRALNPSLASARLPLSSGAAWGAWSLSRVACSWATRLETLASWEKAGQGRQPSSEETPDSSGLSLSEDLERCSHIHMMHTCVHH